jgi:hypothetical protein
MTKKEEAKKAVGGQKSDVDMLAYDEKRRS